MSELDRTNATLAGVAALALAAGVVLFGGVQAEVQGLLAAVLGACAGAILFRAGRGSLVGRAWAAAALALPAWLLLQLIPFPAAVVGLVSPVRVAWLRDLWPGPLTGCRGPLLGPDPPAWTRLTIDPAATWEFLFQVVACLALFFAARVVVGGDDRLRRRLLLGVAVLTGAEAAYGLWQWTTRAPWVLWVAKTAYLDAATGTLINRNHFALLLYVGLGCTLALLQARVAEPPRHDDAGRETAIRTTLGLLCGLQFAGIAASQSRAGIFCSAIVLLSAIPLLLTARRTLRWTGITLLAAVLVPTLLVALPLVTQRMERIGAEWSSEAGRGAVARAALAAVGAFPVTGTGGGTFELAFTRYRLAEITGLYDYAHNDYLQALVETGVPGLVFALLPVVLFAAALFRRPPATPFGDHGPPRPWPVYAALAAVALHEFADFGLHIPALAYLVATLAGSFAPRLAPRSPAGRWAMALPLLALVLAPLASGFAVARWPGVRDVLPFPDLPDVRSARGADLFAHWRDVSRAQEDGPERREPLCRALEEQARAQRLRPASARYAVNHARSLVALGALPSTDPGLADTWTAETSRLSAKARRIDPSDPYNRQRVMEIALALGELDQAVADARAVTGISPDLAPQVVGELFAVGLPAESIAKVIAATPAAYGSYLRQLLDLQDLEAAGAFVPADIRPENAACRSGDLVMRVLTVVHGTDAEGFLTGCLELPEIKAAPAALQNLKVWLASDRLRRGDAAGAEQALAGVTDQRKRDWIDIALAERRKDWDAAATIARRLLEGAAANPESEAYLRYRLARAEANLGDLGAARDSLERALALNPGLTDAERALGEIRYGRNPFQK